MMNNLDCNIRCWECNNKSCEIKFLLILPEREFMKILHDSYAPSVGMMLASGLPLKEAEEKQNIFTMSLVVARMKFLENPTS